MKLLKINDIRVGQVWKNSHWDLAIITKIDNDIIYMKTWDYDFNSFGEGYHNAEFLKDYALIGKLGITHEIKDNKLVEIPRDEFQVDDIVKFHDEFNDDFFVVSKYFENPEDFCIFNQDAFYFPPKKLVNKIGIYGITHEFVNDREVKND